MICACLFLGFKVAQLNVGLDLIKEMFPYLSNFNQEKQTENINILFDYEFYLMNVINYDFYVFCPYKAMQGFFFKMSKGHCYNELFVVPSKLENISQFEELVEAQIDKAFLTDLIFIFSYSYIALASIFYSAELLNIEFNLIRELIAFDLMFIVNKDENEKRNHFEEFLVNYFATFKERINNIKVLKDENFKEAKKKVLKFLNKNPKYVERLEQDRK